MREGIIEGIKKKKEETMTISIEFFFGYRFPDFFTQFFSFHY